MAMKSLKHLTRILAAVIGLLLAAPAVSTASPCCPPVSVSHTAWRRASCCPSGECRMIGRSCADAEALERASVVPPAAAQWLADLHSTGAVLSTSLFVRPIDRQFVHHANDPSASSRPLAAVSLPARL